LDFKIFSRDCYNFDLAVLAGRLFSWDHNINIATIKVEMININLPEEII